MTLSLKSAILIATILVLLSQAIPGSYSAGWTYEVPK